MSPTLPVGAPVQLPDTAQRRMLAAGGQAYRVSVWLPPGAPPPGGFPALFVLDANALFATFVEGVRRSSRRPDATGVRPSAVIGIAPDDDALYAEAARRHDFSWGPPAGEAAPPAASVGGGPAFLDWLLDGLAPTLQAELPLDPARRTLFGHSLAGHFVLQALATRPGAFRTWAAISPSIWWDEEGLRTRLAAAGPGRQGARLFMAVGEYEAGLPPWQREQPGQAQLLARRAARQMVGTAQALADALQGEFRAGDLVFRIFPEEDHASVLMIATQRVLRFASA